MGRSYRSKKTGKDYPSVTSVLPAFLWGNDEARERGTLVHQACFYLNHDALDWGTVDPRIEPYVRAYELLLNETRFKPDKSELTVISEKYGVAGTLDVTGQLGKDYILADIKTGEYTQIEPSWEVQVAAYYKLYVETTGDKRKRKLFTFVLRPDGTYKLFELTEPDAWATFLSYLRIWKWESRHGKRSQIWTG
jgi:hypothetical protein